jgi:hypothetical protein
MKDVVIQDLREPMKISGAFRKTFNHQSYGRGTKFRQRNSVEKPKVWPNSWILHHDTAPAHKALSPKQFLAQKSFTEMEHPPYSHDLVTKDFWMLPEIKPTLRGRRFQDTEHIQRNVTTTLKAVPKMFPTSFRVSV